MRIGNRVITALAMVAALSMFSGSAFADPADDAVPASSAHLQDLQDSEDAYNDYLTSAPDVTCDTRARQGNGAPKVDNPNVGAVYARDVANWSVECVSAAEAPPTYNLIMEIVFQYYNNGWIDIPETRIRCQAPSVMGQAAYPHCVNEYVYPYNHPSNNRLHRSKFELISPVSLTFYSGAHWYAYADADS